MKEIKFRVWDSELNFMYSGTNLIQTLQDPPIWKNHYVLEQYTGLKDKNGVEIYVGDIVCDEENIEYEVYFDEENLCYMFKKGNIIFNKNFFKSLQVIGNIHEVIL